MDYFLDHPWDWFRSGFGRNHYEPELAEVYHPPIVAKDQKEVPEWMRAHHHWETAVDFNKLEKKQMKVHMCCSKCKEIVVEEIMEVYGVFDVKAEYPGSKVVVIAMPNGFNEYEVLERARKIHKKAKWVPLDASEKPKENKKKEDNDKGGNKGDGNNEGTKLKKELQAGGSQSKSNIGQVTWEQQHVSWPIAWNAPRYLYDNEFIQRYPHPYGNFVQFV